MRQNYTLTSLLSPLLACPFLGPKGQKLPTGFRSVDSNIPKVERVQGVAAAAATAFNRK